MKYPDLLSQRKRIIYFDSGRLLFAVQKCIISDFFWKKFKCEIGKRLFWKYNLLNPPRCCLCNLTWFFTSSTFSSMSVGSVLFRHIWMKNSSIYKDGGWQVKLLIYLFLPNTPIMTLPPINIWLHTCHS